MKVLFNCLLFSILIVICYLYVDVPLAHFAQDYRVVFYIPLRILSILISPPTQLVLWSFVFLYVLFYKKSLSLTRLYYPLIASLIFSNTVVRIVKVLIGRSRPDVLFTSGVYDLKIMSFERIFSSLPSGHATTAAALMGFLAAYYPKNSLFYICLGVLLSLSRVFIGAHYLSDVLVGDFIGFYSSFLFFYSAASINPSYELFSKRKLSW